MNKNDISKICTQLNLSSPIKEISSVSGGLLHLMWKLDTIEGSFAIKQLSSDIKLTEKIKKSYELTEQIAAKFKQQGIPAVSALLAQGTPLIEIADRAFLVYPWIDARPLDKDKISEKHALRIAALLAQIHLLNLSFPEIEVPEFVIHSNEKIIQLINKASACQCTFSSLLKENQDYIINLNQAYQHAIPLLKEKVVVSHGDLDQKNVLWDQNNHPLLIDWESARKLNPTYEIINAALDWSGITTEHFNKALFIKMLHAYVLAEGKLDQKHLQAAFHGVLGNWLNWMIFNITRACNEPNTSASARAMATEQVQQVISTLFRLMIFMEELTIEIKTR